MHLHCRFETPIHRTQDPEEYCRSIEITVSDYDEEDVERIVGRLAVDQVLWAEAQEAGVSLASVCDQDSQGLHEVFSILTRSREHLRRDLGIDDLTNEIIFVNRCVIHPSFIPCTQAIVDAAVKVFGQPATLVVMWDDTTGLSRNELAELGFRRARGSPLMIRHLSDRTPFDEDGKLLEADEPESIEPTREHEEWVLREWGRTEGEPE